MLGFVTADGREKVEADSMNSQEQFCNSNHAPEMDIAERELFAFIGAVTQTVWSRGGQSLGGGLARRVGVNG